MATHHLLFFLLVLAVTVLFYAQGTISQDDLIYKDAIDRMHQLEPDSDGSEAVLETSSYSEPSDLSDSTERSKDKESVVQKTKPEMNLTAGKTGICALSRLPCFVLGALGLSAVVYYVHFWDNKPNHTAAPLSGVQYTTVQQINIGSAISLFIGGLLCMCTLIWFVWCVCHWHRKRVTEKEDTELVGSKCKQPVAKSKSKSRKAFIKMPSIPVDPLVSQGFTPTTSFNSADSLPSGQPYPIFPPSNSSTPLKSTFNTTTKSSQAHALSSKIQASQPSSDLKTLPHKSPNPVNSLPDSKFRSASANIISSSPSQ